MFPCIFNTFFVLADLPILYLYAYMFFTLGFKIFSDTYSYSPLSTLQQKEHNDFYKGVLKIFKYINVYCTMINVKQHSGK